MYLDDYLNNNLKHQKKKPIMSYEKIKHLILTHTYNPSNPTHVRMKNRAIKAGIIDEELNIIERK